jgi:undecaprenyl-phosphate 4-deoxy-4-formamido-L-arabinose transferase
LSPRFREYELILINDCSPDESWGVIQSLAKRYSFLHGIDLMKNVGQDNAIMAGLNHARGDVVIIMDDDLQHSPEDIPVLRDGLAEGYDVCYAHFENKRQAWWKNLGSRFNGWLARWVIDKPRNFYLSPFKAIRRNVVAELVNYTGPFPYVDGLIWAVTSRCTQVTVTHHERPEGRGNYTLVKSIRVWLKLLTGFSVKPLRVITSLGFITAGLSFLAGMFFLIAHFMDAYAVPGWSSLFVSVSFLGGIQLICLGMLGEYIGRTYLGLSNRPQYSIRSEEGGPEKNP